MLLLFSNFSLILQCSACSPVLRLFSNAALVLILFICFPMLSLFFVASLVLQCFARSKVLRLFYNASLVLQCFACSTMLRLFYNASLVLRQQRVTHLSPLPQLKSAGEGGRKQRSREDGGRRFQSCISTPSFAIGGADCTDGGDKRALAVPAYYYSITA